MRDNGRYGKDELTAKPDKHEWTALYSHFGWHGDQDAHFHVCSDDGCGAMLAGHGRECDPESEHWIKWLVDYVAEMEYDADVALGSDAPYALGDPFWEQVGEDVRNEYRERAKERIRDAR